MSNVSSYLLAEKGTTVLIYLPLHLIQIFWCEIHVNRIIFWKNVTLVQILV